MADEPTPLEAEIRRLIAVAGPMPVAEYMRVWRPRRRGEQVARLGEQIPDKPADLAHEAAVAGPRGSRALTV